MKKVLKKIFYLLILLLPTFLFSSSWVIEDIRISGLQRVSAGSVFSEIPFSIGDSIGQDEIVQISKSIFA